MPTDSGGEPSWTELWKELRYDGHQRASEDHDKRTSERQDPGTGRRQRRCAQVQYGRRVRAAEPLAERNEQGAKQRCELVWPRAGALKSADPQFARSGLVGSLSCPLLANYRDHFTDGIGCAQTFAAARPFASFRASRAPNVPRSTTTPDTEAAGCQPVGAYSPPTSTA
jgi:hypothetical protein